MAAVANSVSSEVRLAKTKSEGWLMGVGRGTSAGVFPRWRAFDIKDRSHCERSRAEDGGKADQGTACSSSLADHRGAEAWTPLGPTMGFWGNRWWRGWGLNSKQSGSETELKFAFKYPCGPFYSNDQIRTLPPHRTSARAPQGGSADEITPFS